MKIELYNADCLVKLKELDDNSVDSIVTDPPYHLTSITKRFGKEDSKEAQFGTDGLFQRASKGFMGKEWDGGDIAFRTEVWEECWRVLKPGGHLLAFGGTRTYHRMSVAIEDSGFEIRDCIFWCYGSGFPKSHNVGKKLGKEYEGIGTALKPAVEPIVMARKPFKGSVAQNVLEWGTGGINIDGCRIGNESRTIPIHSDDIKDDTTLFGLHPTIQHERVETTEGRFPANLILDEEAGKLLDKQSGITSQGHWPKGKTKGYGEFGGGESFYEGVGEKDIEKGGASRFFYCPKVSNRERNEGCNELEDKEWKNEGAAIPERKNRPFIPSKNNHPTLKPVDLMAYLIRLVTPKGGTVLDPFMGSGSTGKAAMREGMDFIGIEREEEYFGIAEARIEWEKNKNKHYEFFDM